MKWPEKKLAIIADVTMGQSPPGTTYNEDGNGLPFFQGKAEFGRTNPVIKKWCSAPLRIAQGGDILLSVRAPVGPTNIAHRECCIGRGLAAIRAKKDITEQAFLWFFFKYHEPTLSRTGQGSTFTAINRSEIEGMLVPLPPLSEQRRIVEILDQADALRKKRAEADAKAARILPAIFYKMFGDPVTRPMRWSQAPLGKLLRNTKTALQSGPFGSHLHNHDFIENGSVLAVGIDNVLDTGFEWGRNRRISERKYQELKKFTLKSEDVLITIMGTIGRTCVFPEWAGRAICTKHVYRIQVDREQVHPEFLSSCFQYSQFVRSQLGMSITGQIVAGITSNDLKQLLITTPPIELQNKFVELKNAYKKNASEQLKSDENLNGLFNLLLYKAFTGDLTSKWREAQMNELLAEMEAQARALEYPSTEDSPSEIKSKRHAGHDMYNKAALAAYITTRCHAPDRPVGRVKLAKLFYLVQQKAEIELTETFMKRAAGPLDDEIHKFLSLAQKNKWLVLGRGQGDLKPVRPGVDVAKAVDQGTKLLGPAKVKVDEMLTQMKDWGYRTLERWATVLDTAQELAAAGQPMTIKSVKDAIQKHPEWVHKLDRKEFADANIEAALRGLRGFGFIPNQD